MSAIRCPSCNQVVVPPAHYLGKRWRCPSCQESFVPEPAGASGASAAGARPPVEGRGGFGRRALEWLIAGLVGAGIGAALATSWRGP